VKAPERGCDHAPIGRCSTDGCRFSWPRVILRDSTSIADAVEKLRGTIDDANQRFVLAELIDESVKLARLWGGVL
jgi:hypothetical protein